MIAIRRVLCAVDFSEYSRHALDHAVAIARWYRAAITVLHVHRLTTPVFAAAPVAIPPAAFQPITMTPAEAAHLETALDALVAPDRTAGMQIETRVEEDVDIAGAILARAAALPADLIALGTHGRSGFDRFMIGSVAEKVLRKAGCPVLIVPPRADGATVSVAAAPRILCPVDFSSASARAVDYAASLARETEGLLTVLHVVDVPPDSADPSLPDLSAYRAQRVEHASVLLAGTLAGLQEACNASPLVLTGTPYREILTLAAQQQADLIVMGVQGRGAVNLALFGSTTQRVVRQAACPVLTIRAPGHAA